MDALFASLRINDVPRDITGNYASLSHVIAKLTDVQPGTVQRKIVNGKISFAPNCLFLITNKKRFADVDNIRLALASYVDNVEANVTKVTSRLASCLVPIPLENKDAENQDVENQDVENQDPENQDVEIQDVENQDAGNQEIFVPEEPNAKIILNLKFNAQTKMIDAGAMVRSAGKKWNDYYKNKQTRDFLQCLSIKLDLPESDLVQSKQNNGTFVHPRVALHCAQWACPLFAAEVSIWVCKLIFTGRCDFNDDTVLPVFNEQKIANRPLYINNTRINLKINGNGLLMVDATQMCKLSKKLWGHYITNENTQEFLKCLSTITGIPITELKDSTQAGKSDDQGTFVYYIVAAHLAAWCSAQFAVEVSGWLETLFLNGKVELGKGELMHNDKYMDEKNNLKLALLQDKRDYYMAKRQREEGEMEVRKQREEEDIRAKRQREDKAFEEDLLQKKATNAIVLSEQRKITNINVGRELLLFQKEFETFMESIQNKTTDEHIKGICKDIGMNMLAKINNAITGENLVSETRFCRDVTSIAISLGFPRGLVEMNACAIGKAVSAKYQILFGKKPDQKSEKYASGGWRNVNTYAEEHNEWIETTIDEFLKKKQEEVKVVPVKNVTVHNINKYFISQ